MAGNDTSDSIHDLAPGAGFLARRAGGLFFVSCGCGGVLSIRRNTSFSRVFPGGRFESDFTRAPR
jgi:hypothetical protein